MTLAPLADELTALLRAATDARDGLDGGALIDMSGFEPRLERLCAAMRGRPETAGLRPLLRALENELGLLSEAIEARLAAIDPPADGAAGTQSPPDRG